MADLLHKPLQCIVVTPERSLMDAKADFVALPMFDGELGVLPGRAALIGRLGYGELRLRDGNTTERLFIDGGFAQVRNNVVTVLTPRAKKVSEINVTKVEEELQAALAPTATAEAADAALKAQERARAQLAHRQQTVELIESTGKYQARASEYLGVRTSTVFEAELCV